MSEHRGEQRLAARVACVAAIAAISAAAGCGKDRAKPADAAPAKEEAPEDPASASAPSEAAPAAATAIGRSRPATLAVSGRHVCALTERGEVACWGAGRRGQLAPGTGQSSSKPVKVPGIADAVAVVTPGDASCALRADGRISCWGNLPGTSAVLHEVWTTDALGEVVELVAGRYSAKDLCGRRRDGTVACLTGVGAARPEVRELPSVTKTVALASASDRMCALDDDRTLRCWKLWGVDAYKPAIAAKDAVGLASSGDAICYSKAGGELLCQGYGGWEPMVAIQGPLWKAKMVGDIAAAAVDYDGRGGAWCLRDSAGAVSCWGSNRYGQLGNGRPGFSATPRRFFADIEAAKIDAGGDQSCAVQPSQTVVCFEQILVEQEDPEVEGVRLLASGDTHSCAAVGGGQLRCWGANEGGSLGVDGDPEGLVRVPGISNVTEVAVADTHSCAALMDDRVLCWGSGDFGQLGNGRYTRDVAAGGEDQRIASADPLEVDGISGRVRGLALGDSFSCVATSVGVYCWGQLPDPGSEEDPVIAQPRLVLAGGVKMIRGEGESFCALDEAGAVRCWGEVASGYNEVDRGDLAGEPSEPFVLGGPLWEIGGIPFEPVGIAVGDRHACVLAPAGTVHCWGHNDEGQLGDGTTRERTMLTRVDGLEGVTEIDAGTAHTCARKGKEVYCWGSRTAPSADAKDESPSPVRGLEAYVIPAAARAPATPGG
ncbi:MAG: hypothetical protein KC486_28930 [Myxococcales bacterium]|nr:hypothetical protein [Myxococcales bacterium]